MSLRQLSRREFTRRDERENNADEIQNGSLQRIADAAEGMAQNWYRLTNDLEIYRRLFKAEQRKVLICNKRISALRGHITKLNKKIAELKNGAE